MDGDPRPANRHLDAVDETQALCLRLRARFGQAAEFVMVRERQDVDAIAGRALHQRRRRKQAVGSGGVAMEVVVGHRRAWHSMLILTCPPAAPVAQTQSRKASSSSASRSGWS